MKTGKPCFSWTLRNPLIKQEHGNISKIVTGGPRPDGVADDQCHLMVQIMESWFLADRGALEEFYGQGYRGNALPQHPQIEQIAKQDVLNGLDRAARDTSKRGYNKGSHSFEILAKLDPEKVQNASPHAKTLYRGPF